MITAVVSRSDNSKPCFLTNHPPGVPKMGELQEASNEAFKAHSKGDQSQEGVGRRPRPKKGILGRGLRLQRPVLASEISRR